MCCVPLILACLCFYNQGSVYDSWQGVRFTLPLRCSRGIMGLRLICGLQGLSSTFCYLGCPLFGVRLKNRFSAGMCRTGEPMWRVCFYVHHTIHFCLQTYVCYPGTYHWFQVVSLIPHRILYEPLDLTTNPWPEVSDKAKDIVSRYVVWMWCGLW